MDTFERDGDYRAIPFTVCFIENEGDVLLLRGVPDKPRWANVFNGVGAEGPLGRGRGVGGSKASLLLMRIQMANKTLSDVQPSIDRFVTEARVCAKQELGFAAMSTIFPVLLAVSEAANPDLPSDEDLIKAFVRQMTDKTSWIVLPQPNLSDDQIAQKLVEVRNGLAHQLSLPDDIVLTNTISDARSLAARQPEKYFISTTDFVDTIEKTVRNVIKNNPTAHFDPHQQKRIRRKPPRGPATRQRFYLSRLEGSPGISATNSIPFITPEKPRGEI